MPDEPARRTLPPEVLDAPVVGVRLAPGTLRDQLDPEGPTLLVFLRHFGCLFCRETVSDIRAAVEADPRFPRVLFFFQGTPTEGRVFLSRFWPEARAVSDPGKRFYEAFGLTRGRLLQMFGPGVWRSRARAQSKGHAQGDRQGDVWMMPGVFLVRDGAVVWEYAFRHAGDQPDFARIPELAEEAAA